MRKKIIAGNWKMYQTPAQAKELIEALLPLVKDAEADVVFCVPFVDLALAVELTKDSNVKIGAQNMHEEEEGAFTGEIAPGMLTAVGASYVILGHSERRQYFAETDQSVNRKLKKAHEHGLCPIVCCGESLEQREAGETLSWIQGQITAAFDGVTADLASKTIIAYEPIWAIGTGKVATTEQAEEVCAFIRQTVAEIYDEQTAEDIRIQYGGSVKPDNAAELFAMPNIDGGLVGGASLKPDFAKIVHA